MMANPKWEDTEELEAPAFEETAEAAPLVSALPSAQPPALGAATPEPTVLERLRKGTVGAAETLGSLASGAIAAPVAGLVGLANLPLGADRAANLVRSYQEGLTYEPRTETGQAQLGLVSAPFTL